MFCLMATHAQVSEHVFTNGVKGITFDSIKLLRYTDTPDGMRVYLTMKRTGAVQTKTGPVLSGGMDKIWLSALGVVDFSKDFKVVNEEVTFLRPDKVTAKEYNLLDGVGKRITDAKVIATQDDCVKSNWDLLDKYPELKKEEEEPEVVRPKMYYDNTLNYSMLGGKPKSFSMEKYTLKDEEKENEKSLLEQMFSSDRKYDKESKSVDMESYRGSDKKNYWINMSSPACDPKNGNVYTHHGHILWGEMGNKSNEFEQETVVFDKDGKELNRTDIKFDLPHALDLRQLLFTETPEDNLYKVDGFAHVYKQNYGLGYKKLNPEPDKSARKFYQWDASGKLLASLDFAAPHENANVARAFHNGNNISLLATTSYKPAAFYTLHFADGKLAASETLDSNSPLVKGIGFTPAEIGSLTWEYTYSYNQPDGSKFIIYQLKKEISQGQTKLVQAQGFVLFRVDKDGKLTHAQHIKRSPKGDPNYKINFKGYQSTSGKYVAVVRDPLVDGTRAVDVYEIDGSTLEMKKLLSLDGAADLSTKHLPKANSVVFFSNDPKAKAYKMSMVKL